MLLPNLPICMSNVWRRTPILGKSEIKGVDCDFPFPLELTLTPCPLPQLNSSALGFCAADSCCQNKTDEAGMMSCVTDYSSMDKYIHEHPRCGTNGTCYPGLCDSYVSGVGYEGLADGRNAICNGVTDANGTKWEFEGCYRDYPGYPDHQLYAKTVYCGISKCLVDGGSYATCICQAYKSLCEVFGDVRKYAVSPISYPLTY